MPWTCPSVPSCPATGTDVVMRPSAFLIVEDASGLLSTVSVPLSTNGGAAARAACATATCVIDSNCRASRVSKRREWTCVIPAPPALVNRSDPSHCGARAYRIVSDGRLCRLERFCGWDGRRANGNRAKPRPAWGFGRNRLDTRLSKAGFPKNACFPHVGVGGLNPTPSQRRQAWTSIVTIEPAPIGLVEAAWGSPYSRDRPRRRTFARPKDSRGRRAETAARGQDWR